MSQTLFARTPLCVSYLPTQTLPSRTPSKELAASVRRIGVLVPIVCLACGNEITVIDGKQRVGAASDAGISPVPVVIIPSGDYNPHEVIHCISPCHETEVNYVMTLVHSGLSIKQLQEAIGCTPAVAASWHRLKRLIPALVYRYRKGDMTQTVALLCSQHGTQIQTMIAAYDGTITEERVDAVLAHWEKELDSGQLILEESPSPE